MEPEEINSNPNTETPIDVPQNTEAKSNSRFNYKTLFNKLLLNKFLVILILGLIILALSGVFVLNKNKFSNQTTKENQKTNTDIKKIMPTLTPTPTIFNSGKKIPTPTKSIITPSPTPSNQPTASNTPAQAPDTTPPTLVYMTGPSDGSTIDFNSFCFPMMASDNKTGSQGIQTRYKFDGGDWNDWGNNYSPCYNNVSNGQHTFNFEFKDEAGNTSSVSRAFTVQI